MAASEISVNFTGFCKYLMNSYNLVPRAIMSFSCRTQPPVMTLVPTYTFVGNLFQAFVMYARVGLRGSRRFGLVLTGTLLCLARNINQLHLNYYVGLSLFKDVRAYAYASKES